MPGSGRYAELQLYFGLCISDGIREGQFDLVATERYSRDYYGRAMSIVQRYIDPWKDWGVHIGGINPLVQNEQEAQLLIKHAMVNIPNARGKLTLVDSMHGMIRFWRTIVIYRATQDQSQEIIETMKRSGFQPKDEAKEQEMRWLEKLANSGDNIGAKIVELGLEPDRLWRENLKFY